MQLDPAEQSGSSHLSQAPQPAACKVACLVRMVRGQSFPRQASGRRRQCQRAQGLCTPEPSLGSAGAWPP